jgi:hypothetical protein
MPKYLRRFRETSNKCYNITIGENDLADLDYVGLSTYLKEKMEGQEFVDVNQVLQRALVLALIKPRFHAPTCQVNV